MKEKETYSNKDAEDYISDLLFGTDHVELNDIYDVVFTVSYSSGGSGDYGLSFDLKQRLTEGEIRRILSFKEYELVDWLRKIGHKEDRAYNIRVWKKTLVKRVPKNPSTASGSISESREKSSVSANTNKSDDVISVFIVLAIILSDVLVFFFYAYQEFGLVVGIIYSLCWPIAAPIYYFL